MTSIFYIIVLSFAIFEIAKLGNSKEIHTEVEINRRKRKEGKKISAKDLSTTLGLFAIGDLFYFSICLIGLLSSQWIIFLVLILMGFVPKRYLILKRIDSIISIMLIIFIVLNKFHLHINILSYVGN